VARLLVETSDPEVARAVLQEQYTVRIDSADMPTGLRLAQDSIGGVDLASVRYGLDFTAVTEQPTAGTYLARLVTGEIRYRSAGQADRWGAGDVFVAAPAGAEVEAAVRGAEVEIVVVDPASFAAVARTAEGGAPSLTGRAPINDAAARRWLDTVDLARRTAADPDVPPLVAGATARLVVASALAAFPNDAVTDPTIEDRRDARPRVVRVAVAFIEAHPDQDLTVAEVADAASVTPRALQLAFRRHLQTTPTAYLRRVRLDRAHQELRAADPERVTVTAVAGRWGFGDPSRFARRYREAYGELPNTTLHS
jgi:AraC-like DNA-binding protein